MGQIGKGSGTASHAHLTPEHSAGTLTGVGFPGGQDCYRPPGVGAQTGVHARFFPSWEPSLRAVPAPGWVKSPSPVRLGNKT